MTPRQRRSLIAASFIAAALVGAVGGLLYCVGYVVDAIDQAEEAQGE